MVQALWKIVWSPKKLKMKLSYAPNIPLPSIHPKELKSGSQKDRHTFKFIATKFTISKIYIQCKYMDEENVEYHLASKISLPICNSIDKTGKMVC
jgi:hypothetical protein